MRATGSALAGIGLLLLAIVLAARGAAPVAAERLPQTATPTSAHVALDLSLNMDNGADPGETFALTARGEGDVDTARSAAQFSYELRLPAGRSGTDPTPEQLNGAIVMVDGRLYLRDPETRRWTWVALSAGSEPLRVDPAGIDWSGAWGGTAPDFTRVGAERLNGAATTHWRATYDLADLIGANPSPAPTPIASPPPPMTMAIDVWIGDADRYVHRSKLGMDLATVEAGGAASRFTMVMTIAYSKFDQPVSIVAPDGAVPAGDGNGTTSAPDLFPSLAGLPNIGSTFALPGGGGTIAGSLPGTGGFTFGRPSGGAPAATPGQGGARVIIGTAEPTTAAKPAPAATLTPTAPRPTATVAVVANAALPPTVVAQPQAAAQAPPQALSTRTDNRPLLFGAVGLVALLGLAGGLIVAGRRQTR